MRRFVFFTSLPNVGGHTTITLAVVKLLREHFDDILVISRQIPGHGTSEEALTELKECGVQTISLNGRGLRHDLQSILAKTKHRWRRPDVFLAMGMRHLSPILSMYLRPKRSVYYHITHELTPTVRRMLGLYSWCFSELAFISPATEKLWLELSRCRISTCSITQPTSDALLKSQDAVKSGPIKFGFIGRLSEGKGCDVLINFARSCKTICSLRIAGAGNFAAQFNQLAEEDNLAVRVQFDGEFSPSQRVEFQKTFFEDIDYLVVPSQDDREGIPTVILESLNAGVPVIATRTGGILAFDMPNFRCSKSGAVTLVDKSEVLMTLQNLSCQPRYDNSLRETCREFFRERFSDEVLLRDWKNALGVTL